MGFSSTIKPSGPPLQATSRYSKRGWAENKIAKCLRLVPRYPSKTGCISGAGWRAEEEAGAFIIFISNNQHEIVRAVLIVEEWVLRWQFFGNGFLLAVDDAACHLHCPPRRLAHMMCTKSLMMVQVTPNPPRRDPERSVYLSDLW